MAGLFVFLHFYCHIVATTYIDFASGAPTSFQVVAPLGAVKHPLAF
jgi:hypothetical protein